MSLVSRLVSGWSCGGQRRVRDHAEAVDTSQGPEAVQKFYAGLTYVEGVSTKLRGLLEKELPSVKIAFKYNNKISRLHTRLKAADPIQLQSGVVYKVPCKGCSTSYVGHTISYLRVRMARHARDCRGSPEDGTMLSHHAIETGHEFDFDGVTIQDRERKRGRREFKEKLHIMLTDDCCNKRTDDPQCQKMQYDNVKIPKIKIHQFSGIEKKLYPRILRREPKNARIGSFMWPEKNHSLFNGQPHYLVSMLRNISCNLRTTQAVDINTRPSPSTPPGAAPLPRQSLLICPPFQLPLGRLGPKFFDCRFLAPQECENTENLFREFERNLKGIFQCNVSDEFMDFKPSRTTFSNNDCPLSGVTTVLTILWKSPLRHWRPQLITSLKSLRTAEDGKMYPTQNVKGYLCSRERNLFLIWRIKVVILGYLRWDQEPGDNPRNRSKIWLSGMGSLLVPDPTTIASSLMLRPIDCTGSSVGTSCPRPPRRTASCSNITLELFRPLGRFSKKLFQPYQSRSLKNLPSFVKNSGAQAKSVFSNRLLTNNRQFERMRSQFSHERGGVEIVHAVFLALCGSGASKSPRLSVKSQDWHCCHPPQSSSQNMIKLCHNSTIQNMEVLCVIYAPMFVNDQLRDRRLLLARKFSGLLGIHLLYESSPLPRKSIPRKN
ncbi:unnamed protein product, partial [Nesidiocoris tenuis]